MRVFMLGWEFPPYVSGGLGTACYGLTRGLDELGVKVIFVLPKSIPVGRSHVELLVPAPQMEEPPAPSEPAFSNLEMHQLPALLSPYRGSQSSVSGPRPMLVKKALAIRSAAVESRFRPASDGPNTLSGLFGLGKSDAAYGGNMIEQVKRYASLAVKLALTHEFDVIHAHDWMTFPAGLAVAAATGKPLLVQVHSTEYDRSGDQVDPSIFDTERAGMIGASRIICVSHLTRNTILSRYRIPADKVEVIYNAVDLPDGEESLPPIHRNEKLVLFLGRMTLQKGPEYFLQAAQKVVQKFKNVRFVMAGSGDMAPRMVRMAAEMGLGRHVLFTGFLRGDDVARIYRMADLYVMPSVSEPFGIAALEAMAHKVPVILSKQSGASEVLKHVLKVDFWDTDDLADKILAVLKRSTLKKSLQHHGQIELRKLTWRDSAEKLLAIYRRLAPGGC